MSRGVNDYRVIVCPAHDQVNDVRVLWLEDDDLASPYGALGVVQGSQAM